MGTQEVLSNYAIEMSNSVNIGPYGSFNNKLFLGGFHMESFFDLVFRDPDDIYEEILFKVDYVLNGYNPKLNTTDLSLGGIDTNAIIYDDAVRFHEFGTGKILQTVPLGDFKIIATAWLKFLRQSPLSGSVI
jgi:hypothetical protein